MKTFIGGAVAVSAALLIGSAATAAAPTDETSLQATASAQWVPRKLSFIYQGFTSQYTCDGLRDQMKQILQQLGAGNDLVVKRYGCTRLDGPEQSPGVQATFSVLSSAGTVDHGAAGSKAVAARWDTITLNSDTPHQSNWGDCELIEQVKRQVLPLFTTRNLTYTSSCFPHDVSLAGVHLSVEVLRPLKLAAAQPAPP